MPWTVHLTNFAQAFLEDNVHDLATLDRVEDALALLGRYPRLGRRYDPAYEAAKPPFPCRALTPGNLPFTLYYAVREQEERVIVFDIEWSSGNPAKRFSDLE